MRIGRMWVSVRVRPMLHLLLGGRSSVHSRRVPDRRVRPPLAACPRARCASGTPRASSGRPGRTRPPATAATPPPSCRSCGASSRCATSACRSREIAELVRGGDARVALERRREELEAARREAERRLRALDISVAMADDPAAPDVVVRPVAEELVAWVPLPAGDEPSQPPGTASRRPSATSGGVARHRPARRPSTGSPRSTCRSRGRSRPAAASRRPCCRPSGSPSVLHRGRYEGLPAAEAALERWTRDAGLRAAGPVRTLYVQFGAEAELRVPPRYLVDRAADLVTELQLPVA